MAASEAETSDSDDDDRDKPKYTSGGTQKECAVVSMKLDNILEKLDLLIRAVKENTDVCRVMIKAASVTTTRIATLQSTATQKTVQESALYPSLTELTQPPTSDSSV